MCKCYALSSTLIETFLLQVDRSKLCLGDFEKWTIFRDLLVDSVCRLFMSLRDLYQLLVEQC